MNGILVAQVSQLWEGPRTVVTHLHIQQMRTLKESWVERHLLDLPMPYLSLFLSPCPLLPWLREGVLGRMAFVQLRAPPGYFRQAKVWGVGGRCPPPIQGLFQSELEEPGSRGSCPKPRQRCYRLSVGSVVSECPECPNTLGPINPRRWRDAACECLLLREWASVAWGRVAGQLDKPGVVRSARNSKEGQDGSMSSVLS